MALTAATGNEWQQIGGHRVERDVISALKEASRKTNVDFSYLVAKAAQESGFKADAEAPTSSATGLFQFIDSTWLDMVRDHGSKYGLGHLAAKISSGPGGAPEVGDAAARREILNLRTDPRLNALMAGEFANENRQHLESRLGRPVGPTELYLAHFLGAGAAGKFLSTMETRPTVAAADLFPAAAGANRTVFFEGGRPKTLKDVYDWVSAKMSDGMRLAGDAGPVGWGFANISDSAFRPGAVAPDDGGGQELVSKGSPGALFGGNSSFYGKPGMSFETLVAMLDMPSPTVKKDGRQEIGQAAREIERMEELEKLGL